MSLEINRIVILNLDSFTSGAGMDYLLRSLGSRCVLLVESKRFGGKYGGVIKQSVGVFRKSGFGFLLYQAFNLLYYKFFVKLVQFFRSLIGLSTEARTLGQLSRELGIKRLVVRGVRSKEAIEAIKSVDPDLIVSFYFDHIIPDEVIRIPKLGVVNVHTADLPQCKGPFPVLCTVLRKTKPVVTLHAVQDEVLDSGPILAKEEYVPPLNMDVLSLDRWVMRRAAILLSRLICDNGDKIIAGGMKQVRNGFYMSYPRHDELKSLRDNRLKLWSFRDYLKYLTCH